MFPSRGREPGSGGIWARLRAGTEGVRRPLKVHNYRLYFASQLVSLCGTWMQTTALALLVLELTDSGTALGLITAAQFVPTLLFGPFAGVLADRFDKRRMLIVAQSGLAVTSLALATLTLTEVVTYPVLVVLALALGMFTVLDAPARQAFVGELVGREALPNAVGLNSALFNSARIVGPAVAGVLLSLYADNVLFGVGVCFLVNSVSFLAVIGALTFMRRSELMTSTPVPRARGQIREGIAYAFGEPTLRLLLAMIGIVGVFALNYQVLLPLIADRVYGGGARTLSILLVTMGAGSLVGSLVAATRGRSSMRLVNTSCGCLAVALVAATIAPALATAVIAWFFVGLANMTLIAATNTTLQLTARPDMRGRVIALYFLMIMGSTPIGGPITGWVAETLGTRWGVGMAAAAAGAATVLGLAGARGTVPDAPGPEHRTGPLAVGARLAR